MAALPDDRPSADPSADRFGPMGLTFDDVCLVPNASDVVPAEVSTTTRLTDEIIMEAAEDSPSMIKTSKNSRFPVILSITWPPVIGSRSLSVVEAIRWFT